jgi:hypothetical protein
VTDEKTVPLQIRLAGWTAMALVVCATLEAFSFLALSAIRRQWFTYGRLQTARAAIAAGRDEKVEYGRAVPQPAGFVTEEVVHPYLGFVFDRAFPRCLPELPGYRDALDYGFYCSDVPLIQHRSPDTVILGLFGGSVAYAFPGQGIAPLREELSRAPRFAGKKIVLLPLALPGYKQPQQLMTETYFLMLGAEFDLVVNLDGFNELTLPAMENVPQGVFPLFPRAWYFRTAALTPTVRAGIGEVAYLRRRRISRARLFSHAPLRFSTTASLIWSLLDRRDTSQVARLQLGLLAEHSDSPSFVQQGPARSYPDESALYAELVAAWRRSSLQMHRLSQANGATYVHFLQPDQYLPGSKPISDEELRVALGNPGFRHGVEVGYPLARNAGLTLAASGVHFHDMTQVFAGERRQVYIDDCCHFNALGYELLARAMARAIIADTAAGAVSTDR